MFLCLYICPVNVPVIWLNMIDKDTFRVPATKDLSVYVTYKNKTDVKTFKV